MSAPHAAVPGPRVPKVLKAAAPAAPAAPAEGCYTTSDPHYPPAVGAPARMADGRSFTDYRGRGVQYAYQASEAWGSEAARARMTHGATTLAAAARAAAVAKVGPGACVDTMTPELYKRVCTWEGCKTIGGHFAGIGTGRIYAPAAAAYAADPQELAQADVPPLPATWPVPPRGGGSNCAPGRLDAPHPIAATPAYFRVAPARSYSAPRV
jgi:hypothetical protein